MVQSEKKPKEIKVPLFVTTLEAYIQHKQREAREGNSNDYRPTYQQELDDIALHWTTCFENGQDLIASVSAEDKERCRKLYQTRKRVGWLNENDLVPAYIDDTEVLVPAHLSLIREMQKLRAVLA